MYGSGVVARCDKSYVAVAHMGSDGGQLLSAAKVRTLTVAALFHNAAGTSETKHT